MRASLSETARTNATLIGCFAEREAKTLYKRSILGWLWSLINPLMTVGIYSLVFGVIFRSIPPATANGRAEYYALYLFSGLVIWNVFTAVIEGSMRWLRSVSGMRKKIYFPTETAILGGTASTMLQSSLEVLVLVALMTAFGNASWTFVFLPIVLLLAAAFGLGIGFIVSILNIRYRDVQHLVAILLRAMFFLVPIVFTPDIIPDRAYGLPVRRIMEVNPLNSMLAISRDAAYFLRTPDLTDMATAALWAVVSFSLGLVYFRRKSMQVSEEP